MIECCAVKDIVPPNLLHVKMITIDAFTHETCDFTKFRFLEQIRRKGLELAAKGPVALRAQDPCSGSAAHSLPGQMSLVARVCDARLKSLRESKRGSE